MLSIGVAIQRLEVIPVVNDVRAHLLGCEHRPAYGRVVGMLRMDLDGDSDWVGAV